MLYVLFGFKAIKAILQFAKVPQFYTLLDLLDTFCLQMSLNEIKLFNKEKHTLRSLLYSTSCESQ